MERRRLLPQAMEDPTVQGTISIVTDPYFQIDNANTPTGAAIDGIFTQAPGVVLRSAAGAITGRVYLNDDNSLYTGAAIFDGVAPAGPGSTAGLYRYNGPLRIGDFQFRKIDSTGELEEFIPGHKANVPLERYSVFARANYELSDNIEAHFTAQSVESEVTQLWQVSPATGGWSHTIPYGTGIYAPSLAADGVTTLPGYRAGGQFGLNCPATGGCTNSQAFPVSPELDALLRSRTGNPNAPWNLSYSLDFAHFGIGRPRSIDSETRTNQLSFGLTGNLEGIDGSWDVVASHGTTDTGLLLVGYAGLERVRQLIQSPNYGRGFFRQANAGPPGNGFAGGVASCTSGVPVFRPHSDITQDCLDAMFVDLQHQSEMEQNFVEANVQGKLVEMPAGEARFSAGVHSRTNTYRYIFDTLNTQGSFLDLGLGTFPANSTRGKTEVSEVYGELLLPLFERQDGRRALERGARLSLLRLQVPGRHRYVQGAHRLGHHGYAALPRRPPASDACAEHRRDVPGAVADLVVGDARRSLRAQHRGVVRREPGVQSGERRAGSCAVLAAHELGRERVLRSRHAAARGLERAVVRQRRRQSQRQSRGRDDAHGRLRLAAPHGWDAARRLLGHARLVRDRDRRHDRRRAGRRGVPSVLEPCDQSDVRPQQRRVPAHHPQSGDGRRDGVERVVHQRGRGAALRRRSCGELAGRSVGLGFDNMPGTFSVNFLVSTVLDLTTQATPTAPVIDWKGSLGPDAGTSLNNGAFDYRTFTTLGYSFNDWSMSLRWRHLPKAKSALQAVLDSTTGGVSTQLGAEDSYDVFDASATWGISERTTLRMGIDNLFDKDPVITGARTALDPNPTTGQGTTEAGFYSILGRQVFVGVEAQF